MGLTDAAERGFDARSVAVAVALLAILAFALIARTTDLATNPGGLYPDEAAEGLSARQILRDPGYRPVFIPENGGREALFAYSVAAGFTVAGESIFTLRAVAALWGVVGVLGLWLLGRRFGTVVGLVAAGWGAGSLWLIAVSRDGMRNTIVPFFGSIALVAVLAWRDRPTRLMAALAGAVLAIASVYTYQPLKLLPLLALLWLVWLRQTDHDGYRAVRPTLPVLVAAFLVVAAPMLAAAVANPQAWLGRAIGVTPFNPDLAPEQGILDHLLRNALMFTTVGDPNERHNVAGLPLLGLASSTLAVIGLVTLWRRRGTGECALILLSLPVFLLPPLIAVEGGSPHFLRVLGLAAPLAVLVGAGTATLLSVLARRLEAWVQPAVARLAAGALGAALLATLAISSLSTYLGRPIADRYAPFSGDLVAMAAVAQPADVLVLDDFSALTPEFILDEAMPAHIQPGETIPSGARRALAGSTAALQAALGARMDGLPVPIAIGPEGQPVVWAVAIR